MCRPGPCPGFLERRFCRARGNCYESVRSDLIQFAGAVRTRFPEGVVAMQTCADVSCEHLLPVERACIQRAVALALLVRFQPLHIDRIEKPVELLDGQRHRLDVEAPGSREAALFEALIPR
jgi:hypothetical protein